MLFDTHTQYLHFAFTTNRYLIKKSYECIAVEQGRVPTEWKINCTYGEQLSGVKIQVLSPVHKMGMKIAESLEERVLSHCVLASHYLITPHPTPQRPHTKIRMACPLQHKSAPAISGMLRSILFPMLSKKELNIYNLY